MSLTIPFFGYNSAASTTNIKQEQSVDNAKNDLKQKLIEADQLFLLNKFDDVVSLLEEYKVTLYIFINWFLV